MKKLMLNPYFIVVIVVMLLFASLPAFGLLREQIYSGDGIAYFRDDERKVSCWVYELSGDIYCLHDRSE